MSEEKVKKGKGVQYFGKIISKPADENYGFIGIQTVCTEKAGDGSKRYSPLAPVFCITGCTHRILNIIVLLNIIFSFTITFSLLTLRTVL